MLQLCCNNHLYMIYCMRLFKSVTFAWHSMLSIIQHDSKVKQSVTPQIFTSYDYVVVSFHWFSQTCSHVFIPSMEGTAERTNGCYLDVCGTGIPAVNTFFFIHWRTQRLMEHESGIFLGVVWLSHAPVWRGAAGDAGMRLRHARRAWANSGVNIYGSNWRTAQQGISYISVLWLSPQYPDFFQVWIKDGIWMPKTFSDFAQHFLDSPDTHFIYSSFYWSHFYWLNEYKAHSLRFGLYMGRACLAAHTTSCCCPSFSANLLQLQWS